MLNLETKTSYHVFDEFGMLCIPSDKSWEKRSWWKKLWDKILKREWTPTWSNKSWMDSLGRTILSKIPLPHEQMGEHIRLSRAINSCYRHTILYRHPDSNEVASRDHWSYFIIHKKLILSGEYFTKFIKQVPRMRGMNLWMKSLTGNKRAEWWYYFWAIPGAYIGNGFLRFCRWAGRIEPETTNEWWIHEVTTGKNCGYYNQYGRSTWQKLWAWIIFQTMPAYALHNKAWQIYVMRKTPKNDTLRKILMKRVGKSNLMLRLLFEPYDIPVHLKVTQEEIDNYPHMTGYRPGVYLDETCRRDIRELTDDEAEFNTYEKSLIQKLYDES